MLDTIAIEDQNIPAVGLSHVDFMRDAEAAASHVGMPKVRIIAETVPVECTVAEDIEAGVDAVMDDIVDALIRPLTEEEATPTPPDEPDQSRIVFEGGLQEVNHFFYKRQWTDGLPIYPPTEGLVAEMLTGTDLPPDHVVGKIPPRWGKATVEKIAINAVMAGALPTYMPILIAAVEALAEPQTHFASWSTSTGSFAPCWIVNGPVRGDLKINSSSGVLSPGNMANSAIGRAMLLTIRNIGGARKGIEDMGVMGNPGKYSMVIAENEEDSPWAPMATEAGFDEGDNAVTFFQPHCSTQLWPYGSDTKGLLNAVVANIIPARRGLFCLMITPTHAKMLAKDGWDKQTVKAFISEYARVPAYQHPISWDAMVGLQPKEWQPLNPMDSQRILRTPDLIKIVVTGGPGHFMNMLVGALADGMDWVTKKVDLPADWDTLVKKYGRI
ncbi:MAG: hypothetical protein QF393_14470 [Rhodospirillales bacterium]|nr:hypothetical protein [Rhodospirillaceae bacterium]MDP6429218.1 hypothetical protein [Rhodospirillales bacterium]MDP6644873.1 hypothetical protein [Rhodospirillales bacterium]